MKSKSTKAVVRARSVVGGGLALLLGVALVLAFAGTALAAVETATWKGGNLGDWNDTNNWVEGVIPNNTALTQYEVVINDATTNPEGPFIGADKTIIINKLTISESDSFVEIRDGGSLEIKNEGIDGLDSAGTVKVKAGGRFELNGGSIKSYRIELIGEGNQITKKAILRLNSDTTLNAPLSGATIIGTDDDDTSGKDFDEGGPDPEDPDGEIDGDGKLTLGTAGTIEGELVIRARLVNNGTVDANRTQGKIYLTNTTKSGGSGADFKATAGLLQVNVAVSGSADWTSSGKGFLYVESAGDISGKDLDVLMVGNDNPGLRMLGDATLAGNFEVTAQFEGFTQWQWRGDCTFTGGTSESYVTLELTCKDVFVDEHCQDNCLCMDYAWTLFMGIGPSVIIGDGAHVRAVDNHQNHPQPGPHCLADCLMTRSLTFANTSDGKYDRNDPNAGDAHFESTNAGSGQIEGQNECTPFCDY